MKTPRASPLSRARALAIVPTGTPERRAVSGETRRRDLDRRGQGSAGQERPRGWDRHRVARAARESARWRRGDWVDAYEPGGTSRQLALSALVGLVDEQAGLAARALQIDPEDLAGATLDCVRKGGFRVLIEGSRGVWLAPLIGGIARRVGRRLRRGAERRHVAERAAQAVRAVRRRAREAADPAIALERKERLNLILRAIEHLPEPLGLVFRLHRWGLTAEDIAEFATNARGEHYAPRSIPRLVQRARRILAARLRDLS